MLSQYDNGYLLKKRKSLKRELLALNTDRTPVKIAVLGGSTTGDIVSVLELLLLGYGLAPEFYESEFGQYYEDAVFGNEKLDAFCPDVVYIHTTSRNLNFPSLDLKESQGGAETRVSETCSRYLQMWESLKKRCNCSVIQNNFEPPYCRVLGNMDAYSHHGKTWFINKVNDYFYNFAAQTPGFYISDISYAAARYGLERWHDLSAWYLYKYAAAVDALPEFSRSAAHIIKAIYGKNKKAVVTDLDNTLWGGVIGDDGVEGIEIGHETPAGMAFADYQSYLSDLKSLGIILNIASKNDEENALEGLSHPENVLSKDDFALIKANWDNKAENIAIIAKTLDILTESTVFVDDNPFEREIVKTNLPGVAVPDFQMPEQCVPVIDKAAYFEPVTLSEDDANRAALYSAKLKSEAESINFTDYGEYLLSLHMSAEIGGFKSVYYERITQLTNKSNQFNLTTKRYTLPQIQEAAESENHITLYGKLSDKFGDLGVVSLVIGEIKDGVLDIELWLMSCRVLKRGMEFAMLDSLTEECSEKGIETIRGRYIRTNKNSMVEKLYETFGFSQIGENEWELKTANYVNKNKAIEIKRL